MLNRKVTALAALSALLAMGPASADSVNIQTHTSVANASYVKTESAMSAPVGTMFFGLDYNFLDDALVELDPTLSRRTATLVKGLQTLDMTAGYQLWPALSLDATVPVSLVNGVRNDADARVPGSPGIASNGFALGDVRLFSKVGLLSGARAPIQVALIPELRLPTGNEARFLSDGAVGLGAMLAVERDFRYFSLAANLGYRYTSGAQFRDMDYRHRLPMAIALGVPLTARWALNAEASQTRIMPLNDTQNPGEFYGGLRYRATRGLTLTGGAALGATNERASQDYRVLLGLRFVSEARQPSSDEVRVQASAPVRVEGNHLVIEQEIAFAHNSADLSPQSEPLLNEVARIVLANQNSISALDVEGYCNILGSDEYNMKLGGRRARSVVAYLSQHGVSPSGLNPVSYGKTQQKPRTARMSKADWLRINRRTEFRIRQ